jgi:hypothetical protein
MQPSFLSRCDRRPFRRYKFGPPKVWIDRTDGEIEAKPVRTKTNRLEAPRDSKGVGSGGDCLEGCILGENLPGQIPHLNPFVIVPFHATCFDCSHYLSRRSMMDHVPDTRNHM